MNAKDYREKARESIKGKWNLLALVVLIESLIMGAVSMTFVGEILLAGPLALGIAGITLAVVRGKEIKLENMFDGFGNFVSALLLYLLNTVLIFLWSLLLIVPGIIKAYAYSMSFYVLKDNPNMEANDARKASEQMMYGHKWKLFCLHFSFNGWILLSALTFGILMLWVLPYMRAAEAHFYENLKVGSIKAKVEEAKLEEANA